MWRRQQLFEMGDVLEPEPLDGGAVAPRHLAAVVDRLVRAGVEEDRPAPASSGITEAWMCVIVGRSRESSQPSSDVSCASISSYMTGLPSSRDQLGCVPQAASAGGIAAITSGSRSNPR